MPPRVGNVLKVLDAFRRLDRYYLQLFLPGYLGRWHSLKELSLASGLSRTTVRDVLEFLADLGVLDVREFLESGHIVRKYRLTRSTVAAGDLVYYIELDRVIVTLR